MNCTYTFNTAQGVKTIEGREAMIEFLGQYGVGAIVPRNAPAKGIHVGIARAALAQAYGDLPDQLERKGLLAVSQTLDDAIDRAAQMRANATGQSFERARQGVIGSVSNSAKQDQTQTEAFKRWFGKSKVVDADGKPLVVYHGSQNAGFTVFGGSGYGKAQSSKGLWFSDYSRATEYAGSSNEAKIVSAMESWDDVRRYAISIGLDFYPAPEDEYEAGNYFVGDSITDSLDDAREILQNAVEERGDSGVYQVYLSIKKPKVIDARGKRGIDVAIDVDALKAKGFDGAIIKNVDDPGNYGDYGYLADNYIAFYPEQIKSAIGNNGNFDPQDPSILRSSNGHVQAFFDPQTGTAHMVAEHLSAESAPGVMMHEVGIHMAADGSMQPIFNRAKMLLRAQKADPFIQRVQARLDAAGESSGEEATAYMVEEYERDRLSAPASVRRWLESALAAVKAWLNRKGILGADKLTVADIAAVARANARTVAWGDDEAGIKFMRDISRSFAGAQSNTSDQHALMTAIDRLNAGEDTEAVRQETGWFMGVDGKWRYEINDADASLKDRTQWTAKIDAVKTKRDAALRSKFAAEEERNAFLRARGESPSRISAETKKIPEFKALTKALKAAETAVDKARAAVALAEQGDVFITIGDVLEHPMLFAAYPGIAGVRVQIDNNLPAGNAAYSPKSQTITLSGKDAADQLLPVLLHEIQHGIQTIEGFASGGSPDANGGSPDANGGSPDANGGSPDANGGFSTYKRLAGEVEARNTEARQNLTDAQRRATPPSQTADVADSDVIVTFNGNEMASAPEPANTNPDIRFSRTPQWQEPKEQPQAEQPPTWGLPEVNKWTDRWDYATYNLQDRQIDTKRVQQSIEANNGPLPDELNVRQREELFYGRDAKEVQDFKTQELNPMLEQLGQDGIDLPEFEQYLHARHAPEANRVMAERNPNQDMINAGRATAAQEITALAVKIEAATNKDELRILNKAMGNAMADLSRWNKTTPYGGSEESRLALSGMSNQQAQEIMDGLPPEKLAGMERSAAMFDAIVAKNRALMVEYGLESRDTVDGWAGLFQHYVPLMREEADGTGLHNGLGTGQGFSIKGREVKSRTGSAEKKVVDIVANLAMQRERTITRGEKNRVAATMIELARANPNPDFWKVGTPDRKRVYDRATRTVKWVTDPAYKQRDEVVVAKFVKDNGQIEEVALTFNKADPRAMRMATAFKNLDDASLNKMLRTAAPVTRALAALSTQYNPTWGIFNFTRDTFGLMISLGNTPLTGKNPQGESTRWRIYKDAWKALPALWRGAHMERKGKEDTSVWGQLWEDFQKVGGATGFRDMIRTSNERTGQLKTVIDPDAWMETTWGKVVTAGGTIKPLASKAERGRKALFDWISDFNLGLENASRVATYKAALDQGLSKEQAASIAKNITVNFNRRGAVGHQIGAAYAFFNASVQGTARMAEAVTVMSRPGDPRSIRLTDFGRAVVYGGLALGALQALALAAAGFEDDEPPEFVRDRNLTLPTGWTGMGPDKGYINLPMPLGYNIIPAFGRRLTEFVLSGGKDPFKHASGLVGLVFEGFNPIGSGSFTQMLAPSVLDPIVAAIQNEDSFGRPIARETMDRNIPGHQLARDAATDVSRFLSRTINTITGGDEYTAGKWSPSPDQLDYVVGQYGGGVAREIIKLWQLASGTARGEEVPFYKVPLLGRFAGSADSASSQGNAYYGNINKIDQAEKRIKGLTEDGKRSEAQAERRKPEALLIAKAKVAEREVSRLRQEKRRLLDAGAERAKVRAVEAKITDAMRRLNEAAKARGI